MCTGRIDLAFVLRAFAKGAAGVFIAGCHLHECNYLTQGNFYALSMVSLCKGLLAEVGADPARLRIVLISGGEATRFADVVNEFTAAVLALGPLGRSEEGPAVDLQGRLEALTRLVPYIKVEMREKLRAQLPAEAAYDALYSRDEIHRLLHEVATYYIDPEKCQACKACAKRCPVGAIEGAKNRVHVIDQEACIKCGTCLEVCPPLFGAVTKLSGVPAPPPPAEDQRAVVRRRRGAPRAAPGTGREGGG